MRSRLWATSLAIAICVSTALAQHDTKKPTGSASAAPSMPSPEPGPEMRRLLEAFSGTWSITYRYDPSDTIKVTKSTDARPARSKPPKQ